MSTRYMGLIERFRDRIPLPEDIRIVSLNEGNTPLVRLNHIPENLPIPVNIYVKFEGMNPTGSFKDRGMCVAVTEAVNRGVTAVICASTGNTSASAAAYAARAGIQCFVVIPEGKIATGKLAQAIMHGAHVLQIEGNFDVGMAMVKKVAEDMPVALVNSVNPFRLHGQKTAAFEIIESLGRAPDYHCIPVGNAGNISAYWMGYKEYFEDGLVSGRPKMLGYQAEGAAPFLAGHPVENPETFATAIRIGSPQSWDKAWSAQRESHGWFGKLSDDDIFKTQQRLAAEEGIFCEPASAVSLAGLLQDIENGKIAEESQIVCTLTGHGLKDASVIERGEFNVTNIPQDFHAVEKIITERLK